MRYTTHPFIQPDPWCDVRIILDRVDDLSTGERLTVEDAGSYTITIIDWGMCSVNARRMPGLGEAATGAMIPPNKRVYKQGEPAPLMVPVGEIDMQRVTTFLSSSLDITRRDSEVIELRAELDELRKKFEGHEREALMKQSQEEEEMFHRNKNTDPELTADKARRAKISPWMVKAHAAQEVQELHENLNQLKGLELADAVNRSVALYYEEDPTVAGVVTAALSCLPGEPSTYYASIVRYTAASGAGKIVVAGCKAPGLEAAIRGAAKAWLEGLQAERRKRIEGDKGEQEDFEELLTRSLEDNGELVLDKKAFLGEPRQGDTVQVFAPDPMQDPTFPSVGSPPLILGVPLTGTIGDGTRVKA